MSEIELEGVKKRYPGGVLAVDDVSLTVADGEFVTLVGPSGCGKTTTLRIVAGFERPSGGTVRIGGEDVTAVPSYRRDTSMVFQNFALFPHLSVFENVAYGLRVGTSMDRDRIENRVGEMLDLVELPDVGERTPDQLSGGQQQRIALARALAPEPSALLLDEPLASLDKKLRESMQIELRRIQQQVGITTILVTHNQDEALTMSDRIAVMNVGRFEQVGTPDDVYDRPQSRFVADFVGTANLFDGTVRAIEDDAATVDCDGLSLRVAVDGRATLSSGDAVTVVVRPEKVALGSASGTVGSASENGENAIDATVEFGRRLGGTVEYHLATSDGHELIAVEQGGTSTVEPGRRVRASLSPSDCFVLPAEPHG